ncbi:hypothetical protein AV530_010743 [Patagioenas fasciata monilis]|uniref:Uncharacterized protein n=1 Tax=Patagioenas fasciata monilis TaxID=372326 RepID=A0A1V4K7R1_PATFA|nr:hypothetical protein AV530_010743 [Patagioenas fasciata monilis]
MGPPGVVKGRLNTKQTESSLSSLVVPWRPGLPHARRKVDLGDKGRVWMVRGMNPSLQQCQKPQEKTGTQRCCTFAGLGSAERSRRAAALTGAKEMVPVSKLAISIGKTDKK